MLYTILTYVEGFTAPQIENTGSLEVARRTAVDYSKSEEVQEVVIKNNETCKTATYRNGVLQ